MFTVLALIFASFASAGKEEATASHILYDLQDEETCKKHKKEIESSPDLKGKFAEYAKSHSKCPSGREGGSLGSFGRGMMVPEFEKVIFAPDVKENIVYGCTKTQFGHHLILVTEKADENANEL